MRRKLIVVVLLSVLALACAPLSALSKPQEIQETAEAMVGTVQAVVTQAPELMETVQAAVTEAPELIETVQAAVTEQPGLIETAEAAATQAPDLIQTLQAALTESPVEAGSGEAIRQWAVSASASSSYSDPAWSAQQATGAPDTPTCDDKESAWAALSSDAVEWLEVTFARSVVPTEINIYETYTPDQVVRVEMIDITGGYHEVYAAQPVDRSSEPCPYILHIPVSTDLEVSGLRITIDQSVLGNWNEIDAVELVGQPVGN